MTPRINIAIAESQSLYRLGLACLIDENKNLALTQLAENGKDLINQIETSIKKPDVVLMDIYMPVMNGYEATKKVLQILPSCKILFLSSHANRNFVEEAKRINGHGFLNKTSSVDTLYEAIELVHSKGLYYNDFLTIDKMPVN